MKISIIIPTKNEPYVGTLISQIRKIFKNNLEIIVIEKGKMLPKVKAKVVRQRTNGLGNAVVEGLEQSKGDTVDTTHRKIISLFARKFALFVLNLNIK